MDHGPLVTEEIEAGAELVREFDKYQPVKAAFWLRTSTDEGLRFLYIASDGIDGTNLNLGYREVGRLVQEMQNPDLDQFRVKLINTANPLARAAVELCTRFPVERATRVGGSLFGGRSIEDAYIYPMPLPAAVA